MDDVRGDFLGPPHGTTPAAVPQGARAENMFFMTSLLHDSERKTV